jgi:hypothetical protein
MAAAVHRTLEAKRMESSRVSFERARMARFFFPNNGGFHLVRYGISIPCPK